MQRLSALVLLAVAVMLSVADFNADARSIGTLAEQAEDVAFVRAFVERYGEDALEFLAFEQQKQHRQHHRGGGRHSRQLSKKWYEFGRR
ncbi:hypothetical protein BOX15_Mlig013826g1 [Macrostomum lignano]|uniref:Uncharacterized protein n=1 Tax=Macrostomum lignano TaxID=282301 RepID=A0A267FLJ3_9PLAT|nr:hypothetical protein BOX15_Mlig013826g1 [Macrostomum lignano]